MEISETKGCCSIFLRGGVYRSHCSRVRGSLVGTAAGGAVLAPKLKVDNKSAIALMKNPVHHDRSKHIDVKFHFIRECCDRKLINVEFVGTELQLGDILTKALGHTQLHELRGQIGIKKLM